MTSQMTKVAVVVGDRGQDGRLLSASLEMQGFEVIGISREALTLPESFSNTFDLKFSITNADQVSALIKVVCPSEVYYLAAHHTSSEQNSADCSPLEYDRFHKVHVVGLLNFLIAIRDYCPSSRLFYAASSLVFSGVHGPIQDEETPFSPYGFYGLTKTQGIYICREFRHAHKIFASSGILYNHESVLRSNRFLSKKLIISAHRISLGLQEELFVGNLSSETDWGYAPDYIDAFQLVIRNGTSDDFVVATGESHSVAEFARIVFDCFGLDSTKYVRERKNMLNRHIPRKIGNYEKFRKATGWNPSYDFRGMVQRLVRDYLDEISNVVHK